jgi:hypothetical protein
METSERYNSNFNDESNGCKRAASPHHMPVGSREVPLVSHEHPPLNFARQHHRDLPSHDNPDYAHYRAIRALALSNSVRGFEQELSDRSPVDRIVLQSERLTVQFHSQSKLSQQELADLQKATHFDKKELQQWYKGMRSAFTPTSISRI